MTSTEFVAVICMNVVSLTAAIGSLVYTISCYRREHSTKPESVRKKIREEKRQICWEYRLSLSLAIDGILNSYHDKILGASKQERRKLVREMRKEIKNVRRRYKSGDYK